MDLIRENYDFSPTSDDDDQMLTSYAKPIHRMRANQ
jgi:hypothetical protein